MSDILSKLGSDLSRFNAGGAAPRPDQIIHDLPLAEIIPDPEQVRTRENAGFTDSGESGGIKDLMESIQSSGVKTPIVVREMNNEELASNVAQPGNARYMIVSGERRWRACKALGLETVPAIIRTYDDLFGVKIEQITENIQRAGLSPMEIAKFIRSYILSWDQEAAKALDQWLDLPSSLSAEAREAYEKAAGDRKKIGEWLSKHRGELPQEWQAKHSDAEWKKICSEHPQMTLSELGRRLGKRTRQWMQMEDALNDIPQAILPYYIGGKVSDSLRTQYDFQRLYKKDPDLTMRWLNENFISEDFVINATSLEFLKKEIESTRNGAENPETPNPESVTDWRGSSAAEDEETEGEEEDSPEAEEPEDEGAEAGEPSGEGFAGSEKEESEGEDGEPEVQEGREHSAAPSMAPSHQENSAPTAGLGKPDFTDRDTRAGSDLSDRIGDEARGYEQAAGVEEVSARPVLRCLWTDPESGEEREYVLDLSAPCPDPHRAALTDADGGRREAPLSEIRLTELVFE